MVTEWIFLFWSGCKNSSVLLILHAHSQQKQKSCVNKVSVSNVTAALKHLLCFFDTFRGQRHHLSISGVFSRRYCLSLRAVKHIIFFWKLGASLLVIVSMFFLVCISCPGVITWWTINSVSNAWQYTSLLACVFKDSYYDFKLDYQNISGSERDVVLDINAF